MGHDRLEVILQFEVIVEMEESHVMHLDAVKSWMFDIQYAFNELFVFKGTFLHISSYP